MIGFAALLLALLFFRAGNPGVGDLQ